MPSAITSVIVVFIGGGCGSVLRWLISAKLNPQVPALFLGTLTVNLAGALIIGAVMATVNSLPNINDAVRLLLVTGFCGGLTTFSTFSYESYTLIMNQQWFHLIINVLTNLLLSIIVVSITYWALIKLITVLNLK